MNSKIKKSLLFAFMVSVLTVLTVFSVNAKTVTKNKLVYEVSKKTATLVECKSNAKKIKVPSKVGKYKVTAIGEWAFSGKTKLQSVELPKTITKIGEAAFNECTSLKKIVIPSKVTKISASAFWYCTSLEKAVIPESVTKIGKYAFEGCDKLTAYVVKGSKAESYIKKQKHITLGYRYMTSLKLDEESVILQDGDTLKLKVTKKPAKLYNSKVTFSSSNEKVATVSSKGVITAKKKGKAVITCKAKDGSGKKATCTVTVKAKKAKKAVSPAPKAPAAVTGLKATAVTDSSVSLSWSKVTDATGYKIYLYDSAKKTYTYKWATSALKADITGLSAGKEYSFAVKAYTKNYYSSTDSTSYSAVVKAVILPGTVSSITAKDELIYPDRMTLSWGKVTGAAGYNLYIYDKTKKDFILYESTSALSAEVTGLKPSTDYRFRIKTYSGKNKTEGSFSKVFTFTTDRLPATAQQAAQELIAALSDSGKASFELYTRFDVKDFEGENEKTQSVIDALYLKDRDSYSFEKGFAEKDGVKVSVSEVIYPCGERTVVWADIVKDSVTYSQSGYGYSVELDVSSDSAEKIALVPDAESLGESIPGFVLYSVETGQAHISAKVTDGVLDTFLSVEVPVTLAFYLDGEKHEISFTASQDYLFQ